MLALLTSCNRSDLLKRTLDSLVKNQHHRLAIAINEDSENIFTPPVYPKTMINTYKMGGVGQHKSIEKFINAAGKSKAKYYLHLEDDWEFENIYDWISESINVMESDPSIIKVLCRIESPHPCKHDTEKGYGILEPWTSPDNIVWHGFSWNPGVTRLDLLKQFVPFPKWEQDLAEKIYKKGYKVAELINPIYKHIGDGRSTHE
jgi:hypothetical protein